MSLSDNDVFLLLRQHLPPGAEWQDTGSAAAIGKTWRAVAQAVNLYGYTVIDALRAELGALTMTQRIPDWEAIMSVARDAIALYGSTAARRNRLIARRREFGASTVPNISAGLTAVLGSAPTIIEVSRATLTALHTYSGGVAALPKTYAIAVNDAPKVSGAGAQVFLTLEMVATGHMLGGTGTFDLAGVHVSTTANQQLRLGELDVKVDGGAQNLVIDGVQGWKAGTLGASFAGVAGSFVVRFDEDAATNTTVTFAGTEVGIAAAVTKINTAISAHGVAIDNGGGQLAILSKRFGTSTNVRIVSGSAGLLADLGLSVGLGIAGSAIFGGQNVSIAFMDAMTAADARDALNFYAGAGITGATVSVDAVTSMLRIDTNTAGSGGSIEAVNTSTLAFGFAFDGPHYGYDAGIEAVAVTLTAPDSTTKTWAAGYSGSTGVGAFALQLPGIEFAGATSEGTWTLTVGDGSGTAAGSIDSAGLFVEAVGRAGPYSADGRGAEIFHWAAYAASPSDITTADSIVSRLNPGHGNGRLVTTLDPLPSATLFPGRFLPHHHV